MLNCFLFNEKKLAEQLGFDNIDEMEQAIDSMQGIGEEGVEIENDDMAREARIRSAYMDWVKEYGKESDETRFKVFFDNFLTMEKFAEESGKEMSLNQYADCTEAEYKAATEADAKKAEASKMADAEATKKAAEEKKKSDAEKAAKAKADEQAALKAAKAKKEEEMAAKRAEAASKFFCCSCCQYISALWIYQYNIARSISQTFNINIITTSLQRSVRCLMRIARRPMKRTAKSVRQRKTRRPKNSSRMLRLLPLLR